MPRTKIIATLGPESSNLTTIRQMMLAGLDVARLNFSHGSLSEHLNRLNIIRQLSKKYRRHIRVLQDLEGYRIRIGSLKEPIELKKKQTIYLTTEDIIGDKDIIPLDYTGSLDIIRKNQPIFIDDGNISLVVLKRKKRQLKARVEIPGLLVERKGINMPGVNFKFQGVTPKDRRDLYFAIKHKVDFIAQSFVRSKADVLGIKALVASKLPSCRIIAKIENRQGIRNIDEIIEVSDGIMIARGDMGVSVPIYEIPFIQKEIIKKCNQGKKIVITATQMLESMVKNLRPARSEVTDIANAILDGSDYLMLSAETATGEHPVEAVRMMNSITKFTENTLLYKQLRGNRA